MQTNQQVQIQRLRWNADKTSITGTVTAAGITGYTVRINGREIEFNRIGISTCLRYRIVSPVNFTHG
jgi:hypothetical protein